MQIAPKGNGHPTKLWDGLAGYSEGITKIPGAVPRIVIDKAGGASHDHGFGCGDRDRKQKCKFFECRGSGGDYHRSDRAVCYHAANRLDHCGEVVHVQAGSPQQSEILDGYLFPR